MPPANAARLLYAQSIALHIHALREALVRHDELIGAHHLMEHCVPYFLRDDPKILQARKEQYEMVRHVLNPSDYARAYSRNEGEQSFEDQFAHINLTLATADGVPRIAWLVEQLIEAQPKSVVDLGCNDGWMLRHLADRSDLDVRSVRGVDLNIDCVERARARFAANGSKTVAHRFECEAIEAVQAGEEWADAVVCFEVLEHVANPYAIIDAARRLTRPGGLMFFSTPDGAVEQGWLPNWSQNVGLRGHVRSFNHTDFASMMEYAATGERPNQEHEPSGAWTAALCQDLYCVLLLGKVRR